MFKKKRNNLNNLSLEELEQVLWIKQRQARQERFSRLTGQGKSVNAALTGNDNFADTRKTAQSFQGANVATSQGGFKSLTGHSVTKPKKRMRDIILLTLEVGAVIGLVAVLFFSYLNLKELNQEVVSAQKTSRLETVVNQNLLAQVSEAQAEPDYGFNLLPGGHSSPTSEGGAVPDIPAHLQNWVQPAPAIAVPKQSAAVATRIVIPKINVDAPIVGGVSWEDLKKGVGHLPGSAQPGERGNLYLAAHNDIFGEIFRYLDDLEPGDEYYIYAGEVKYTYVVREKRIIEPTEVSVMLPTTEPVATLQTCYPYLIDTHRLVVVSDLVK